MKRKNLQDELDTGPIDKIVEHIASGRKKEELDRMKTTPMATDSDMS